MKNLKQCKKCNELKSLNDYYKWHGVCKACTIKKQKEWREDNKEKDSIYQKNYAKKWSEENKERKTAAEKAWREANREKVNAYYREYRRLKKSIKNPDIKKED